MCDRNDYATFAEGVIKRFGGRLPDLDRAKVRRFRNFVRKWIRRYLAPLLESELLGFEEWLLQTHYNGNRRDELRRALHEHPMLRNRDYRCKSFPKSETYDTWKYERLINSRTDAFKAHTGAFFASVEHKLFAVGGPVWQYFVKRIPVDGRAQFIHDRLHSSAVIYQSSDFSAFESSFSSTIFRACEFQLYTYMARNLPQCNLLVSHIIRALGGINHCSFKYGSVKVSGCRMSGDMCTSLGNGFTNLMLWLFAGEELGYDVDGVVEGDDGIFRCLDGAGRPAVVPPQFFEGLGFRAKIKTSNSLGKAGFCKLHFPDDGPSENVVNPGYVLAGFGWSHSPLIKAGPKVHMGLLRAKANSLLAMYPSCPVVSALGRYGVRVTGEGKMYYEGQGGRISFWESTKICSQARHGAVTMQSRVLCDELFGWTVNTQMEVEAYLDSKNDLSPIDHPLVLAMMRHEWFNCFERFCVDYSAGDGDLFPM